jgi:hypothetical protein
VQRIWKILSVFVVAALALPAGIFASVQNAQNSGRQVAAQAAQLVRVVSTQSAQVVVPQALASSNTWECSLNAATPQNFLQNAEAVNLNKPASCFSLALARPVVQPKLSVVLFRQFDTVVAPNPNRILESFSFIPTLPVRDSALPGLAFVVAGIILFEEKKLIQKLAVQLPENTAQGLTLYQLGVLRC